MRVSALCLLISATFTRLFNAFQVQPLQLAVPELYELIQGVPFANGDGKTHPFQQPERTPPRGLPTSQKS